VPGSKAPGSTTLPKGVIGPGTHANGSTTLPPGYNLLLAVNGMSGRDGPNGTTLGAALAASIVVLSTPVVILEMRRRRRRLQGAASTSKASRK
jgi:hypothetical protein